jgi:hypothetical protein
MRKSIVLTGVMCVVLLSGMAGAVTLAWVGNIADPNDTGWFNAVNWSPAQVPTFLDTANLYRDGTNVVNLDPNDTGTSGLVANCNLFYVGNGADNNTLNVNAGTTLKFKGESGVSYDSAGISYLNVAGTINGAGLFLLPRKGHAFVTVQPGGVIDLRNSVDGTAANGNLEVRGENIVTPPLTGNTTTCVFDMLGGAVYANEVKWPRYGSTATLNLQGGVFNILDTVGGLGSKDLRLAHSNVDDKGMVNQTGGLMKIDELYVAGAATAGTQGYAIYNLKGGELNCRRIVSSSTAFNPAKFQVNLLGGLLNFTEWNSSMGAMVNKGTTVSPGRFGGANLPMDETMGLTIMGNYSDAPNPSDPNITGTPTLSFDLGGTSGTNSYDRITFQGTVSLNSELEINLVDNFALTLGSADVFDIVYSTSDITGNFTNLDVNGRIKAYTKPGGSLEATFLVTIDNTTTPKRIRLSNAVLTNVPPVITYAPDIYTYDAVKNSIFVDTTVTHYDMGILAYSWAVVAQPAGSTITPDPATLTTNDITIGVDMLGDYTLALTATDTTTGKYARDQILIVVRADACAAAKANPAFVPLAGDADGDCNVDLDDFALMAANWLDCNAVTCP